MDTLDNTSFQTPLRAPAQTRQIQSPIETRAQLQLLTELKRRLDYAEMPDPGGDVDMTGGLAARQRRQYNLESYTSRPFPNQHDPIKYRHRIERSELAEQKRLRYGQGSMSSIRNKWENARGDSTKTAAANNYASYINNRINDGFVGRGRYRRNMGRRTYRGRGMYMAGAVRNISGRGSFWEDLKKGRRSIAKGARFVAANYGTAARYAAQGATMFGRPDIGTAIMASSTPITSIAGTIGGRGAYNTLFPELGPEPVQFESSDSEHGNLTVSGSEKVSDIFGNGKDQNGLVIPYSQFDIPLYPGNFEHFPRLAQHAQNFKEYEFVQLIFVYKSTIPPNWSTTNVTTGKIIMSTQMDVNRPQWSTYDDLYGQENKTEGLITGMSDNDRMHTHGVECDPKYLTTKGLKFVRTKGLDNNSDKKDYDLGRLSFGMFGTSSDISDEMVGELWVQYKVCFKNHRMYSSLGYSIPKSILKSSWAAPIALSYLSAPTCVSAAATWQDTLSFQTSPTTSLLTKTACVYNNIDFLVAVSEPSASIANPNPLNGRYAFWFGKYVTLTFPSSLRGDYNLKLCLTGNNLMPDGSSVNTTASDDQGVDLDVTTFTPLVTGTALLNYDMPEGSGWNTSIDPPELSQSAYKYVFALQGFQMECHLHLGQAVSTQENSVRLFIPIISSSDNQPNLATAMQVAAANYPSTVYLAAASLEVTQYNAQQLKGASGFPYE
jgi:hypothetical protein